MADYYTDQDFEGIAFPKAPAGEFDSCTFRNCKWDGTSLQNNVYTDCRFIDCDLSNIQVTDTTFSDTEFKGCKMVGIRFDQCNSYLFAVSFIKCRLDLSSFFRRRMKRTPFDACSLKECDFSEADLSETRFHECDLEGAVFDNSILEKCDFQKAARFIIDPEKNRLKNAIFSAHNLDGLLTKYGIRVQP